MKILSNYLVHEYYYDRQSKKNIQVCRSHHLYRHRHHHCLRDGSLHKILKADNTTTQILPAPPVPSVNVVPHIPSIPPPPPQEQPTFTPTLNTSNLIVPSAKALLAKHESSKRNVPLELTLTGGMIADLVSIQNENEEKESSYQEIDVEKMSPTSYMEPMVESRLEARILGLKEALRKIQ